MATEHAASLEPLDMWTEVGGRNLHYLTAGSGRTPVLLLHGGIVDAAVLSWGATIGPLATERRVIALDLPGYGSSSRPDAAYTTAYHTGVVGEFLDALNLSTVSVVGISMGGGIALNYALANPSRVEDLVLVGSHGLGTRLPHGTLSYVLSRLPQLNKAAISVLSRNRLLAKLSLKGMVHDLDSLSKTVVDEFYRLLQRPESGKAFRRWRQGEMTRSGFRTDFSDRLEELSVSTLLLHGAEDPIFPVRWSVRAAEMIPTAQLDVLDECGHWPPREQTQPFNDRIIEFLSHDRL